MRCGKNVSTIIAKKYYKNWKKLRHARLTKNGKNDEWPCIQVKLFTFRQV